MDLLALSSAAGLLSPSQYSLHSGLGLPSLDSAILLTLPLSQRLEVAPSEGGIAAVSFAARGDNFLTNGGPELGHAANGGLDPTTVSQLHDAQAPNIQPPGQIPVLPVESRIWIPKAGSGTDPNAPRPPEGSPPKKPMSSTLKYIDKSTWKRVQWPFKLVFRIIDKVKRAINHRWVQLSVDRLHRTPLGHAQLSEAAVTSIEGYLRKGADFMRMNPVKWTESKQNQAAIWTRVKGERNYQYPRSSRRIIGAWLKKLSGRRTPTRALTRSRSAPARVSPETVTDAATLAPASSRSAATPGNPRIFPHKLIESDPSTQATIASPPPEVPIRPSGLGLCLPETRPGIRGSGVGSLTDNG
ncbi:hypothetical protein PSTG_11936 [Puccinia striiformis f. sp. tritici PST-78]|uniref:Uncharacterized protein n=1 Tax=Puccinia striiformis f. sp. tritici PST-78 TaxID=1165861 RepID=A0A0L0V618_9BASI|nr:hypothetical protein PSTG_11936 [Puccinia striiformis f. sp. tritici PST-78]